MPQKSMHSTATATAGPSSSSPEPFHLYPPDPLEDFAPFAGLYLRALTRVAIHISLPPLRQPGQSISNWDLMERLKKVATPVVLDSLRVKASTMEKVTFEGELQSKAELKHVIRVLDKYTMKVMGFIEPLKVRAVEAPSEFPLRNDWDSFFRDPKNDMNELIPGERPDTIYLGKIPCNWLQDDNGKTCEKRLKQVMERFGEIRVVDIPACDPYRSRMDDAISGIQTRGFGFGTDVYVEGYVQYMDYHGFAVAMEALRNKKWVRRMDDGRLLSAVVKVDFDRSKHLTEKSIRRRRFERELLKEQDDKREEEARRTREEEEQKIKKAVEEKEKRREAREEKRRQKNSALRKRQERLKLEKELRKEKNKLVLAVKRVESIRLLASVFERIEVKEERKRREREEQLREELAKQPNIELKGDEQEEERLRKSLLAQREAEMRQRIKEKMMQNGLLKEKKRKSRSRSRSGSRSRRHHKSKKAKKRRSSSSERRQNKKMRRSS